LIAIIDHGMGNLGSVQNMLRRVGAPSIRTTDPQAIQEADRIVLAGIGGFDGAMGRLEELGLVGLLTEQALERRKPILGVCLGMQLMARRSAEGRAGGLAWLDAECEPFAFSPGQRLPVPLMGWQEITITRASPLFDMDADENQRFYFSHTYHVVCHDSADVAATATYGDTFTAAIHHGNLVGTQFHPEKSHAFGMQVYRRFLGMPA
jgi:glutamine amidotransferase